jgi:hypothetical protein
VAVVATLLVLLSAAFAEDPIRDAVTLASIPEAHLEHSTGYLAIAPMSDVLDTLTLLGARQHIVVIVSLIVVYAAIRIWRATRRQTETDKPRSSIPGEAAYAALFFVAIVLMYAAAAVLPRPMAALATESSDVIVTVDFHSHTRYSHDGRPGWDPADVRSWHRSAGFDAAYISDHRTVQGAELGIVDNPTEAGQGTMLLQALEAGWRGEHVNILGANRFYKGLTTSDLRDVDEQSLALALGHGLRSIAFPSISTGAYRFPIDRAARIAVDAVRDHAASKAPLQLVRFVCFSAADLAVYEALLSGA